MADEVSDKAGRAGEIAAGSLALAALILADRVTALHPLFGLPLFLYLIRDFNRPSSRSDRLIVSMAMSFVILLFACYPIELVLDELKMAQDWDIALAIQWFFVFPWVWAIRTEFELRKSQGGT